MSLLTLLLTCVFAVVTPGPNSPGPAPESWRWPLGPPPPQVVRGFSPPTFPWGPGHRGVDLAARPGQPVYAAGPGRVTYADRLSGRGVVAIGHGVLRTTYLPVRANVRVGHRVTSGSRIGTVEDGLPHCPMTCLHWGLLHGSLYLNPLSLVQRELRLLPHWERPSPPEKRPVPQGEPGIALRDATGGALTGMALTFTTAFVWRRTRTRALRHRRRRPPPGVIDLSHERRLRRTP
ncbi:peptidase M23-like protein [Actinomadura pelletieri DSM 43383]|uniref:Peptidase M23-like protein n=1 Tax=Actinomadura pelletieri DSM 43383 TaxID=1120940 RepID=A0A495QPV9_9ACTN|nr:M23 family metallopeptidase [Actinomadura pelletieri]RKS75010.1 peptidase M23-like protein [Actinomadura pelletieri DSM 43383]